MPNEEHSFKKKKIGDCSLQKCQRQKKVFGNVLNLKD